MDNDNDQHYPDQLDLPGQETPAHQPEVWAHAPKSRRNKSGKKVFLLITSLVLVAGLGIGALFALRQHKESTPKTTQPAAVVRTAPPKDVADAPKTELYENGFLGFSLQRPSTWTATETKDTGVRIESPDFHYTTSNKGDVTGNFRLYIRKGARAVDSGYIGRGVALAESQKLVYVKPAVGQRTDTWLTLYGLDRPDNFAYFMIAGNFHLQMGDTLGPGYGKEPETYIITGGYSAKEQKDDLATNEVPLSAIQTSNAYKQAVAVLASLQLH